MKRRVHNRKFKVEAAHQVVSGQKRSAQVCREHNLSNCVLEAWPGNPPYDPCPVTRGHSNYSLIDASVTMCLDAISSVFSWSEGR